MFIRILLPMVSFMVGLSSAAGETLQVPSEYATIQSAISAASDGDTVLVAAGQYDEQINFLGKAIHVVSSDGPEATIIRGSSAGVVTFANFEGDDSVLEGEPSFPSPCPGSRSTLIRPFNTFFSMYVSRPIAFSGYNSFVQT